MVNRLRIPALVDAHGGRRPQLGHLILARSRAFVHGWSILAWGGLDARQGQSGALIPRGSKLMVHFVWHQWPTPLGVQCPLRVGASRYRTWYGTPLPGRPHPALSHDAHGPPNPSLGTSFSVNTGSLATVRGLGSFGRIRRQSSLASPGFMTSISKLDHIPFSSHGCHRSYSQLSYCARVATFRFLRQLPKPG